MAWLWEWDPTTCTINKPNREAEPLVVKFRNKIWKSEPLAVLLTFIWFVMDWMWFFWFRRGSFPRKDQLLAVLKSACLKIHLNDASFSQENAFTRQTRQLPLDRRDNSATKVQKEFLFLNIQIFTTQMAGKLLSLKLEKTIDKYFSGHYLERSERSTLYWLLAQIALCQLVDDAPWITSSIDRLVYKL